MDRLQASIGKSGAESLDRDTTHFRLGEALLDPQPAPGYIQ